MTCKDNKWLSSAYRKYMKTIFKSAHNRRCTFSIGMQTLCKVWILLIENCLSYRLHQVSTALLARTDGRTEKAIPRPASAFGDAGTNTIFATVKLRFVFHLLNHQHNKFHFSHNIMMELMVINHCKFQFSFHINMYIVYIEHSVLSYNSMG
jgi:hypothetical protein